MTPSFYSVQKFKLRITAALETITSDMLQYVWQEVDYCLQNLNNKPYFA